MRTLPATMIRLFAPFAPLFSKRVFRHAQVLLVGTILAPGQRTVSSALRVMGLGQQKRFHCYHRVLSRASWSSVEASRILLRSLVEVFVPEGPLIVGIDETLERRYGKKIAARGIYRDPVRSTREHFVKSSGLRWVCVMLLVEIPWASRVWALPFLSVLAPSERYAVKRGKRHKKITEWAWQLLLLLRRWPRWLEPPHTWPWPGWSRRTSWSPSYPWRSSSSYGSPLSRSASTERRPLPARKRDRRSRRTSGYYVIRGSNGAR